MEQENVSVVEKTTKVETPATENKEEEKTFTQKEVDEFIKVRLRNMPNDEELKQFKEWKESQKTEAEKLQEISAENTKLKQDLENAKNEAKITDANVDSKFKKFVLSEISVMNGDFEENLTNYLKNNPQYLIQEKTPVSTGITQNNSATIISEEKAYLDKKYANNPYYKK